MAREAEGHCRTTLSWGALMERTYLVFKVTFSLVFFLLFLGK